MLVTRACVRPQQAEDIAQGFEHGPVPPLERGVGPLKPRVPLPAEAAAESASVTVRAEAAERAASLWPILRQLLRCVRCVVVWCGLAGWTKETDLVSVACPPSANVDSCHAIPAMP